MVSFSRNSLHNIKRIVIINTDGPPLKITERYFFLRLTPSLSLLSPCARTSSLITIASRKKVRHLAWTFRVPLIKIRSSVPRAILRADACTASNYVRDEAKYMPSRGKHRAFPGLLAPQMGKLLNLALSLASTYYALAVESVFFIFVDHEFYAKLIVYVVPARVVEKNGTAIFYGISDSL